MTGGKFGFVGRGRRVKEADSEGNFREDRKWVYAEEPGQGQKAIGVTNSSELRYKWVTEEGGSRLEEIPERWREHGDFWTLTELMQEFEEIRSGKAGGMDF